MTLVLTVPCEDLLLSYLEALREGPFRTMQLGFGDMGPEEIEEDPKAYIRQLTDPVPYVAKVGNQEFSITKHELLWLTDGTRFLGTIALRYAGDSLLLDTYAGHIGLAIRPQLLNKGFGIRAIRDLLEALKAKARAHGLTYVIVTCDPENRASKRLIEFFGGILIDTKPNPFGPGRNARYRISIV